MSKKVLVMMGGFSAEREVSLVTGKGVAEALQKSGFEVIAYDLHDVNDFIKTLQTEKPDVVFNALHGNWGEDGTIQGMLDLMQIPYTHSGLLSSAIGMNKYMTKKICHDLGIHTVQCEKMSAGVFLKIAADFQMPYVVKPVSDGSSVGVFIIKTQEDLKKIHYDDLKREVMVERFIDGKELTVMTLEGKAYVVTELRPKVKFYDYEAKYTSGATEHILPAEIPDEAAETCKRYAERLHKALGCNTLSRCDFRYNPQDGVVMLEINTHPGMTPFSLVPEQAKYVGISYEEVCVKLVLAAKCRGLHFIEHLE